MKKIAATLCIVGTAFAISACTTDGTMYDSGANYATERTAGEVDKAVEVTPVVTERVFKNTQAK